MKLIFVADPMCSWCYGFAAELAAVVDAYPKLPVEIRMGGIRAGDTQVMTEEFRQARLTNWARVEAVTGLIFNRKAFNARDGFVYDTEPACRAFVTARELAPQSDLLTVFQEIQVAFYVAGRDITSTEVLIEVAVQALHRVGAPVSAKQFREQFLNAEVLTTTAEEFLKIRSWGVNSFPALILEAGGQLYSVASAFTKARDLRRNLDWVLHKVSAPIKTSALAR